MSKPETAPQTRIVGCASPEQAVALLSPADQQRLEDALKNQRIDNIDASPASTRPRGPR